MAKLLLTTGDLDGIGLEIAIRALNKLKISHGQQIYLYCGSSFAKDAVKSLRGKATGPFNDIQDALKSPVRKSIFVVGSKNLPPLWVEEAGRLCLAGKAQALVTGPLSKPLIKKAGLKDLGHTEILARVTGEKNLFMSFWGSKFNVVLLTGHLPLRGVSKKINPRSVKTAVKLTRRFVQRWKGKKQLSLALVGLNPHAGDRGLIGNEESHWMDKLARSLKLAGPLPGDSAFIESNLKKYQVFFACYHDQGLIPFKIKHGFDEGVHVTLGLPFLRTSVDHGPAKEFFGLGRANYGSMKNALEMALQSVRSF